MIFAIINPIPNSKIFIISISHLKGFIEFI
ncbi:hypothetical protein CY0110_19827 [Crocosphaera chwakensis CCY0110]|uniref:Uncharacterized protein n=1 Tax=Crocosphaera chwakensis CCY0110 TaxID=391612 RepID=A3IJU7_9CHRO|nr:hypothetical protein CY0110_19827 [Crocosphaera chwakensis CCY0110]